MGPNVETRERDFWNAVADASDGRLDGVLSYRDYLREQSLIWREVHGLALGLCGTNLEGTEALDLGCGIGIASVVLAERGARVTALDIAEKMVAATTDRARRAGLAERVEGRVGTLEDLARAGPRFDLIFAGAVLHHLPNFARDVRALAAMVRPGGRLVGYEPLSSLLFDLARDHLEYGDRFRSEDERPLSRRQCEMIRRAFGSLQMHPFGPFTALERVAMTGWRRGWRVLRMLDRGWFGLLPGVLCWHVVLEARKPDGRGS